MTRKSVSKKLTRQHPVIPPIKEGEELVEILASFPTNPENFRIERKAFFLFYKTAIIITFQLCRSLDGFLV